MAVIAHRGGSGDWRENTLEAFEGARAMGADGVELDARSSSDGVLVVHHDAELATGQRIDQLSQWELPEWIPDLASVVAACAGMLLNIEIKLDGPMVGGRPDASKCRAVASALAELLGRGPGSVVVSSFWPDALVAFGEVAPHIPTGLLVYPALRADYAVSTASNLGCSALHPNHLAVSPALVDRCHAAGLEVATWTVNEPADVRSAAQAGVDAVITDDVASALDAVGRAG